MKQYGIRSDKTMKNRKSIMGCLILLSLVVLLTIISYGLLQLISLIHIDDKVFLMLISVYVGSLLTVVITLVPMLDEEVKKEKAKRIELEKQLEKSKEQISRYEETLHDIVHNM